jgi:hypothetical protein
LLAKRGRLLFIDCLFGAVALTDCALVALMMKMQWLVLGFVVA